MESRLPNPSEEQQSEEDPWQLNSPEFQQPEPQSVEAQSQEEIVQRVIRTDSHNPLAHRKNLMDIELEEDRVYKIGLETEARHAAILKQAREEKLKDFRMRYGLKGEKKETVVPKGSQQKSPFLKFADEPYDIVQFLEINKIPFGVFQAKDKQSYAIGELPDNQIKYIMPEVRKRYYKRDGAWHQRDNASEEELYRDFQRLSVSAKSMILKQPIKGEPVKRIKALSKQSQSTPKPQHAPKFTMTTEGPQEHEFPQAYEESKDPKAPPQHGEKTSLKVSHATIKAYQKKTAYKPTDGQEATHSFQKQPQASAPKK